MKQVDEIMTEYGDRRSAAVGRNLDFYRLHSVYEGLYYDMRSRDIMDGQGRVILRDNRREDRSSPLVANLLKGIVDDYVALTGVLPDVKVPAPDGDQAFADVVEKYHYGVWWASQMVLQLKAMGWWNSVMGGCSALVWPNFKKRHAEIRFIGPDKIYGVMDLVDPFAYSSAIIVEPISQKSIEDYFPQKTAKALQAEMSDSPQAQGWPMNAGRVELIRWLDKKETVTVLGRQVTTIKGRTTDKREAIIELGRAPHDLNLCPLIPFQNIFVPGQMRGVSDIEEAVGLNQFINFLLNAHEEYVKQELFSPVVLIDPQKAPEDIDLDSPTAIIPINAGGDAKRLVNSTQGQQVMSAELSRTQQLIEYVTGSSAIRTQGRQPASSIATGRSLEKGQGPQFTRVEYRNDLNAHRLEKVNEASVLMTGSMFADDDINLWGTHRKQGSLFKMTIKGSDLRDYTFNQVKYSPSMYMGLEQRITAVLQLMGAADPLTDRRGAIEFIGMTDHPDEMMARIDEDQMRRVKFQQDMQKAAQGGQPGGGEGPASVLEKNVALEAGATNKQATGGAAPPPGGGAAVTGAPPPEGGAPPAGGGPAAPGFGLSANTPPEPDVGQVSSGLEGTSLADQVEQVVSGLKLTGRVYLVEASAKSVQLIAERYVDARKVRRALYPLFGSKVSVRESKKVPPGAREVSGRGTQATRKVQPQG